MPKALDGKNIIEERFAERRPPPYFHDKKLTERRQTCLNKLSLYGCWIGIALIRSLLYLPL